MTVQLADRYPIRGANPTPAERAEHRANLAKMAATIAAGLAEAGEYEQATAYRTAAQELTR